MKKAKSNSYSSLLLSVLTFFLGISIVVRCKPTLFYINPLVEYGVIAILTIMSTVLFIFNNEKKKICFYELFIFLTPFFFIRSTTPERYMFFSIVGILYFFFIQKEPHSFKYVKYPLIVFAIITAIVSWIGAIKPQFYIDNILVIFEEWSSLKYSFLNRGMNHGLTNHYSRNSFYITLGIICLLSEMSGAKKKKWPEIILFIFLFATLFMVGKRGISLFLIFSILITEFIKGKNMQSKLFKVTGIIITGLFMFFIAYLIVPQVNNIVTRTITLNNTDDVSNGRFYLYGIALNMFKREPILGNGWNSFLKEVEGTTFQAVHNDYLQLLAETGIIGALIFLSFNYFNLKISLKAIKNKIYIDSKYKFVIMFSILYQLFFLLYSLTGYPHFSYEQILLYYMASGSMIGVYKKLESKVEGEKSEG